jgi:hypothetical protein
MPFTFRTFDIRVSVRNIGDFNVFYTSFSRNGCPSLRCFLAGSEICNNVSMFSSHFFNISFLYNLVNM